MRNDFRQRVWLAVSCALCARLLLALLRPVVPDDGAVYARIATNLIEQHVYSSDAAAPFSPEYFRMPGYPLFLAATYGLFGVGNDVAVRVLQALADTLTCVLVALLARMWCARDVDPRERRRVFLRALVLAAACPFTIIYASTILTETLATMTWTAAVVVAVHALRGDKLWLLAAAGLLCAAGAWLRPDGVLVPLALCGVLVAFGAREAAALRVTAARVLVLAGCFGAALAPWTVRNAVVFGKFIPIAPKYANLRGEFVETGYRAWLRTWVDDYRYIEPFEWRLGSAKIAIEAMPERAFDSPREKARVALLLDRYARPQPGSNQPSFHMTPQIDAAFGLLARERIARHPIRTTAGVGLRRVIALWFDTHSDFYPFAGPLFPWADVPAPWRFPRLAFIGAIWAYTLFAAAGLLRLWRAPETRVWALLFVLLFGMRMTLLATLENPEPRYTVELFPLLSSVAALGFSRIRALWPRVANKPATA